MIPILFDGTSAFDQSLARLVAQGADDLVAHAEIVEDACVLLTSPARSLAEVTATEREEPRSILSRESVAAAWVCARSAAFVVCSIDHRRALADRTWGEHVLSYLRDADDVASRTGGGGAALVRHLTPVAVGDPLADPSQVRPTGGAARFGSALGVYDGLVCSSVLRSTEDALLRHGPYTGSFARAGEPDAHARAVGLRMGRLPRPTVGTAKEGAVSGSQSEL